MNDYLLMKSMNSWEFNEDIAQIYDNHVRKTVQLYDEQHRNIDELWELFINDGAIICDFGTSTGEAIFNLERYYDRLKVV